MSSPLPATLLKEKDEDRASLDFLRGGGEMGALIREIDWSHHPLGKPDNWPQSLKTSVSLILSSQHPMWIGWSTEMFFLYNDAYLHVLGLSKHPWALGRPAAEVWSEIWDVCGPLADRVFREGKASFVDDVRLFMNRGEFLEETYYSFSYSPIRDEAGQVGGLFCPSNDVTPKVLGARRLGTLSELSSNALIEKTAESACATAVATLAKNPDDIPFAILYLIEDGKAVLNQAVGIPNASPALAPRLADLAIGSSAATWPLAEVFHSGKSREVALGRVDSLPSGTADQSVSQAIVLPVVSSVDSSTVGLLVAGTSPARRMDADYQTFFHLVATHIGTAIQNARAAEAEKKRADALAELDRAKTAFFSNVSHEFRTPLTLMLGPLENLLARGNALAPEDREEITTAHRNSLRLLKLVNSLLDFSRIEAGRLKALFSPVDLARLTVDLASNFRSAMEAAGLDLKIDCEPLPQPVYVDPEMWEKIVLNLLSNAFKFTFEGFVRVRLRETDGSAVLTVEDTGTGIPESELPHICERFHRVEGARGRTYEGTGIGLALIQELVKLHGGSVAVQSRIGEGSAFSVTLPFGSAHLPKERIETKTANPRTAMRTEAFTGEALTWIAGERLAHPSDNEWQPEPGRQTQEGRPRILLADDNADMREHVGHILGARYDVVAASDGRAALEEVRRMKPDLILSDVMMPQLDGFGLLHELRSDPRTVDIPVIMLSARAGEEARTEGMGAGADDYLTKPFSARELLARISAHLRLVQLRREAAAHAGRDSLLLSAIVDSSDDAIISKDLNGVITSWNKSAQRLFGFTAEEAVGQPVASLLIPADRQEEEPVILARLRSGQRVDHFETVRRCKDGTLLDISLTISPVRNAQGVIIGASKIARDIGYRKRTEQLDREQTRLLEMIASGQPFEDCLTALTEAVGRLRPGARAAVLMTSRDGRMLADVFSAHLPSAFEEALRGVPISQVPVPVNEIVSCVDVASSVDLPKHWNDLYLGCGIRAYRCTPISAGGRPVASFFLCFSETRDCDPWELRIADFGAHAAGIAIERERVAAALRQSEQEFRELAEVGPQIVWLSGPRGELEFVNRRWIEFSGLDCEATRDPKQIAVRLHPDDKLLEHWQKSVATGTSFELEARLRRKDGEFRWFMMRSVPIRDQEGRIVKWFGTSTDIHQNKLLELELRSANRDLEQFAYSVSHDLREPLRSVKLFSELLTRRYRDRFDGQALEFLDYLRNGASRMEMLVRDLLEYTQTSQSVNPLEPSDASAALHDALSNLARAIDESGATIEYDPLPRVSIHVTQLQQLFQNLVGNAIKYHRPGIPPAVRVCAQRQNDEWLFSVADNGIGIEPEYKERIFGLFKRLHTGGEYSGSGIGLALCQRIVERHHGRIWVESEPGKGSIFYFTLPI